MTADFGLRVRFPPPRPHASASNRTGELGDELGSERTFSRYLRKTTLPLFFADYISLQVRDVGAFTPTYGPLR
jgi:hypothetical protein